MNRGGESANVILRIDRTLSGYRHQDSPSYTGLRCATLCSAIQPLWGPFGVKTKTFQRRSGFGLPNPAVELTNWPAPS